MDKRKGGCLGVLLLPLIAVVLTFGLILMVDLGTPCNAEANGICATPKLPPVAKPAGAKSTAGFSGDQLKNAGQIMSVAADLGLPVSAQLLGVQAAIGESTLRVIDFGDGAGPDSRGLFQQRDNGAWGPYADRMNPRISATNFFKALQKVECWERDFPSTQARAPNHKTLASNHKPLKPKGEQGCYCSSDKTQYNKHNF